MLDQMQGPHYIAVVPADAVTFMAVSSVAPDADTEASKCYSLTPGC